MLSFFRKKPAEEEKPFVDIPALTPEQRGVYAKQALDNPILQEAFREVEKRHMSFWRTTYDDQINEREIAFQHVKALEHIKQVLTGYVNQAMHDAYAKQQKEEEEKWKIQQPS